MTFTLAQESVQELIEYVDRGVRRDGCDHTLRFSAEWAAQRKVNWDDLLDALEQHGAFCDCEVVLNLEEAPLTCESHGPEIDVANRWLLPPDFTPTIEVVSKILVSKSGVGRNNHTQDGEWLFPAPFDAIPRKRIRKSVHFFLGIISGLPTEIGFVAAIEPIPIGRFAQLISSSNVAELNFFDRQVVAYACEKIARFPEGKPVGTGIRDCVGIASKHQELNIHRVVLRR